MPVKIIKLSDFDGFVGKEIQIIGKIAKEIWQHMTSIVDSYPFMEYFDLDFENSFQIVIYTKDKISCKNKIEITGKLMKVSGRHKDPRSKIHDDFFEYQLAVDSWRCVD
ncbi:hypothetical protein LCGC14_1822780 [marine sediment metagenome]|uniref:Uncharacterized protein n=1 Tax=marine sediment metagenome TaxID=412755 RepID=A0A0F9IY49_9ZZZZ|nr:MAG: hypothetical protein Lokiarch_33570 [Candidatus Lokiarchaeum sp. GC14_75]